MQADLLRRRPEVVLVSSEYDVLGEDGVLRRVHCAGLPEVTAWRLLFHNQVGGHSQVMFRRHAVLAVGGDDPRCAHGEDYDLWSRLREQGTIEILPLPLMTIRKSPLGLSSRFAAEQQETARSIAMRQIGGLLGRPWRRAR